MRSRFFFSQSVHSTRLMEQVRTVATSSLPFAVSLQKTVHTVMHEMLADLCCCYVLRAGEILELLAMEPSKQLYQRMPAHIAVGEGALGSVASTMQTVKTNQDDSGCLSLCAVPISLNGRLYGVLSIHNRKARFYQNQDVETLQAVAVMIADMIANSDLLSADEMSLTPGDPNLQQAQIVGLSLNHGIAAGRAVLHGSNVIVQAVTAKDAQHELDRLEQAVQHMHSSLEALSVNVQSNNAAEQSEIFETYRMLAADKGWIEKIRGKIIKGLMTAEAAASAVQDETNARMAQIQDPYLKSRLHDFEDLTRRLLMHLSGYEGRASPVDMADDSVLVARSLGPADFLEYDQRRIKAIVLEEGSPSSHVAIMARALGVPIISQCRNLFKQIGPSDRLIIDGD